MIVIVDVLTGVTIERFDDYLTAAVYRRDHLQPDTRRYPIWGEA